VGKDEIEIEKNVAGRGFTGHQHLKKMQKREEDCRMRDRSRSRGHSILGYRRISGDGSPVPPATWARNEEGVRAAVGTMNSGLQVWGLGRPCEKGGGIYTFERDEESTYYSKRGPKVEMVLLTIEGGKVKKESKGLLAQREAKKNLVSSGLGTFAQKLTEILEMSERGLTHTYSESEKWSFNDSRYSRGGNNARETSEVGMTN